MELYKNKAEYSRIKNIHLQTANKREKSWRLKKVTLEENKVWYIDVLEITKDFISKL